MGKKRKKKVLVIGSGLGGIAAAITLAAEGFPVEVFEKNDKIGGKLNVMDLDGFSFDLGPSIIILPHLFRRLFDRSGKVMEDYVEFEELSPQWRSVFEDGTVLDLFSDMALMEKELEKLGSDSSGYWSFMEYSRNLYKLSEETYLESGADTITDLLSGGGWAGLFGKADLFASMDQGVARHVKEPHLHDMLNFFIKYVGSSSYDAPALLNLLPYSQLGYGLWYVKGGMYNLARGLGRLMEDLGVTINLNAEVTKIHRKGERVEGIQVNGDQDVPGDIIVSNMEVIPAYKDLLGVTGGLMMKTYETIYEPAASGLVVHLGVDRIYPLLRHHNFFFSKDPKKHFDTIHQRKELPDDPTIYLVCPTKTQPDLAPEGHDIIKILPHIPYIQKDPFTEDDYLQLKERVLDKLERMGLTDLRKHIKVEHVLTPDDLQRMYYSNKGSIYGVVSNRKKNFSMKAPKQSSRFENLFFVGGSVNPGGGTCMVVLCGQKAGELIARKYS